MNNRLQSKGHARERRLIESDSFPFEFISQLAEMESWRKEVHRPIYHLHKWWAKRLGSVFRGILLGSILPDSENLVEAFYRPHDFAGFTVFDPFMGSGTTIGEAHKLGFTALGRDINPVACESVRVSLGPLDRDALMKAFGQLSAGVGERIRALYETADAEGHLCDALYFFWVKTLPCPACSANVDLFPTYIFVRNAYPDRKPEVRVLCPECAGIFSADANDKQVRCPHCKHGFDLHAGPASGASATCQKCRQVFPIAKTAKAIGHPPAHRMFAKLVLNGSGEKLYLPVTRKDELAYQRCSEELRRSGLPLPTLELKDGHNTRQVLNYAYRSWREFFNDRQLLALGWLHAAILELPDSAARAALRTVFSGVLEFNNMFASYKGEGTGAIRHMFAHHILKPERVPIEGNVWGTSKSSGSFSTLFKSRLVRAIEYHSAPFELEIERTNGSSKGKRVFGGSPPFAGHVETKWPPPPRPASRAIHLSCGSSASTGLSDASVDLVVTDPPFFDNVHYSELADFFFAWQQLGPSPFVGRRMTTRHAEEVQDTSAEQFAAKLRSVFAECCRVLREDGLLVFTYHHSRMDGWTSLADAVVGAGFSLANCHPVKSEMSVAAPKSQAKEPIQLDVVLVCQKQTADSRARSDAKIAFRQAVAHAASKAKRLQECGLTLSVNDRRVILISQFLVETCAGRSAEELTDVLSSNLTDLDLASMRLLESHATSPSKQAQPNERQLALLDSESTKRPSKSAKRIATSASDLFSLYDQPTAPLVAAAKPKRTRKTKGLYSKKPPPLPQGKSTPESEALAANFYSAKEDPPK
jgi:putative DNA methylase